MRFITKFLLLLVAVTPLLGNDSGMYKSTQRLADLCAVQGRVFSFQVRPEHFSNTSLPSDTLQVFSLGSNKPPKWLEVFKWQLRGLPLEGDTGTHNLRLCLTPGRESRILTLDVRPKFCPHRPATLCGPFSPRLEALFAFPSLPPPCDLSPADRLSLTSLISSHVSVPASDARLSSSSAVLFSEEHQILSKHPPDQDVPPNVPLVSVTLSCDSWELVSLESPPGSIVLLSLFSPQLPWLRHRRQTNRQPGQIVPIELELINTETVDLPFSSSSFATSVPVTSSVLITSTFRSSSVVTMATTTAITMLSSVMSSYTRMLSSLSARVTSSVVIPVTTRVSSSVTSSVRRSFTPVTTYTSVLSSQHFSSTVVPVLNTSSRAVSTLTSVTSRAISSSISSSVSINSTSIPITSSVVRNISTTIPVRSTILLTTNSSVVPVSSSLVPVSSSSIPVSSRLVPVSSSSIPVSSRLVPVSSSLVPVSSSLIPVSSSSVPVSSSLIPVSSSSVPVSSSLVPVSSSSVPVSSIRVQTSQFSSFSLHTTSFGTNTSTHRPVTSSSQINSTIIPVTSSFFQTVSKSSSLLANTSQVPVTSSSVPVTSSSVPVTSSSVPVTSSSVPVTSSSVPVTSSSVPITSSSVPVTSSSVPVTSSSVPVTSSVATISSSVFSTSSVNIPMSSSSVSVSSLSSLSSSTLSSTAPSVTSSLLPTSSFIPVSSSTHTTSVSSVVTTSAIPVTTPPPLARITLANPLPLLTPSPGVAYFYDIPNNTFSHPASNIRLTLSSLVGELPNWLNLSSSKGGYQLIMLPPIDSGGTIIYASLVASDQSSTASDVISIRPEVFTPPLHSIAITITTNLSEIMDGGILVSISLTQRIGSVTNSLVRLLSLSAGSTIITVSFVGTEVSRNCSEVLALLAKIQLSNGAYTKEFIAAFAPDYELGESAVGQGVCLTGGTLPPPPAVPSLSESFSHRIAFLSSSVVAILLALVLISACCILIVCCYRYRRYSGMSPAEKKAFLKRRPVVMDTDWSLPPKARTATILPTDLEHIPEEERWLLGPTVDTQPPPAPPRPPQARAPPPFQ